MVKQAKAPAATKAASNKPMLASAPQMFKAPVPAPNAFSAFVAAQKQAVAPVPVVAKMVKAAVAEPVKAPKFAHTEQNGRKDYEPGSKGRELWDTADKLQAMFPHTPVTSAALRVALPHLKPASVSAALTHWRQFHGTLRSKAVSVPVVIEQMGPHKPKG